MSSSPFVYLFRFLFYSRIFKIIDALNAD